MSSAWPGRWDYLRGGPAAILSRPVWSSFQDENTKRVYAMGFVPTMLLLVTYIVNICRCHTCKAQPSFLSTPLVHRFRMSTRYLHKRCEGSEFARLGFAAPKGWAQKVSEPLPSLICQTLGLMIRDKTKK